MYAKKRYGQNFLKSEAIARRIVNSLNIEKNDIIIEIGPGFGALTKYLYTNEGYIGIEIDEHLVDELKNRFKGIKIKNSDFLQEDLSKYGNKCKYIGNLPYYIVSFIMFKTIKSGFSKAVFMVQKEVAERITSEPKRRSYGFLSAFVQYYCDVRYLLTVKNGNFTPVPKVDSAVVSLERNSITYSDEFTNFLKKAFAMKRKTLMNNLKKFYSVESLDKIFNKLNIPSKTRAEELKSGLLRSVYDALDEH